MANGWLQKVSDRHAVVHVMALPDRPAYPTDTDAVSRFCLDMQPLNAPNYLRAKQQRIPDLPRNQQHPQKRTIERNAVDQRRIWKNRAVLPFAPLCIEISDF